MSRYGKIESGFWQNPKVRGLTERGRYLLTYMLSCPHGNAVGCFVLPDGYIADDLNWSSETVSKTVSELSEAGFIERDKAARLVRIIGWWGHNEIANANVAKHAAKELNALPKSQLKQRAIAEVLSLLTLHETVQETLRERLPEPSRNQEQNTTEQEPEQEHNTSAPCAPTDEIFEEFWKAYPRRQGANPKEPARKKFIAAVKSGVPAVEIIAAARRCANADRDKIGTPYIPQAIKWLNDQRWKDYALATSLPITDETWRTRLKLFHSDGIWNNYLYGDSPDTGRCKAPAHVLKEFEKPKTPQLFKGAPA